MRVIFFYSTILILLASSCSVRKYIPEGERIYKGATVKVQKNPETKEKSKSLRKTIELAAKPRPNKFLFGQPCKVWWWYVIGEPKREKGFRAFLRNKLGEPPVFSSRLNAATTAENMQSLMENLGYFHTTVQGDTSNFGYFTKAHYTAQVQPRYMLDSIVWVSDSSALLNLLERNSTRRGFLKKGNPYILSDISAERDRLDLYLKTRGYYYFNPDYILAYADSTVGKRKVNLFLNVKRSTPYQAKFPYKINQITIFPDYSLSTAQTDTSRVGLQEYDTLLIQDPQKKFKPRLFANTITYRPNSTYSSRHQNTTLNRLINLGAFKFVKNRFEPVKDSTQHRLDVYYYLTPAKKKSIQGEIDAFTKENSYFGTQASVNWRNRNAFRGAEQLAVKVYGGIETTRADSLRNNNYRLGTEVSLKIPRYVIPFFKIKENNFYPPNTSLLLGYEWFRRELFYTKNLFRAQYEFTWKNNLQSQFTFAPISLSYLKASSVTDSFYRQAAQEPAILLNVFSEATVGSFFSYTYNSGFRSKNNKWYLNASADWSGNILGLATGAKNYREKTIFGTPFAQYVKFDFDAHYTRKLSNGFDWANRIQLGIGVPYNNSRLLPFAKLYTIGGSNSIRGFRARSLGPGKHLPTADDQRYFQIIGGDFKLLGNAELRIPFTKQLSGALFLDAGNIWTKDTLLFGSEGKLTKDFMKQIAVATGVGVRFDITVLLIRVDLGIPLRKPYLPDGQQWETIKFGSRDWRRDNLVLNIALGLPF